MLNPVALAIVVFGSMSGLALALGPILGLLLVAGLGVLGILRHEPRRADPLSTDRRAAATATQAAALFAELEGVPVNLRRPTG